MIDQCTDDPFEDPGPVGPIYRVWMHKRTGQLYEKWHCWFGQIIAWEDLSVATDRPCSECKLMFDDQFREKDYEDLGAL